VDTLSTHGGERRQKGEENDRGSHFGNETFGCGGLLSAGGWEREKDTGSELMLCDDLIL